MAQTRRGRFTTANDQPIVLFLVEVRINRWRAVRDWWPVVRQMRPLLRAADEADIGLLGHHTWRGRHGITMLQYWSDTDALFAFAHDDAHRKVWLDFYRDASGKATVGIWHETYVVPAGRFESVYGNVPPIGLAGFRPLLPIKRRSDSAAARLAPPVEPAAEPTSTRSQP